MKLDRMSRVKQLLLCFYRSGGGDIDGRLCQQICSSIHTPSESKKFTTQQFMHVSDQLNSWIHQTFVDKGGRLNTQTTFQRLEYILWYKLVIKLLTNYLWRVCCVPPNLTQLNSAYIFILFHRDFRVNGTEYICTSYFSQFYLLNIFLSSQNYALLCFCK